MYKLGIDLGSSYTKGVLVDENNRIVSRHVVKTGFDFNRAAQKIIDHFSGNSEIEYPVYTCGYGREQLKVESVANSEIIALAKAVFEIYQKECSIIDIGGQDNKFIKINKQGQVDKFKMNRKCAAGTGSFIEEIAFRLDLTAKEFNEFASESTEDTKINSYCTVFAVSEIVGMIKNGSTLPNIITGIYNSVIDRGMELSLVENCLVLTGGVVDNHPAFVELFKKRHADTECPEFSQFLAAYGSVLLNLPTKNK